MKLNIPLAMLLLAAAPVAVSTGCNVDPEPEAKRCVDPTNHVLPFDRCGTPAQRVKVAGSIYPELDHRYYYGGYGGNVAGSSAWGGSDQPLAGHVYVPAGREEAAMRETVVANTPQPYVVSSPH